MVFPGSLNFLIARERVRDLHREAGVSAGGETPVTRVTLRRASAADAAALRRLAELDGGVAPPGGVLVAEIDGRLRAALPLDGGVPVSDPFHRGAELIELLRLRAAQLARV